MWPYILDVVSYIEVVMAQIVYCDDIRSSYDVIESAYDVTHIVGVMSYKSGYDISGEVVMTKIQWMRCLIQWV